ncbi:MAG TPA: ribonuclease P protein subunit [Candidatus Nanoarchaeia archaeon]|nr:ribonuclease P protein subunit [Candidatus Nanoarchaeia archaeon]
MNAKAILRHELIGSYAEVVDAANKSLLGIKGRIVDETKQLLVIEDCKERKILKSHATFKITSNKHAFIINGKLLVGRPEDRMKKLIRT